MRYIPEFTVLVESKDGADVPDPDAIDLSHWGSQYTNGLNGKCLDLFCFHNQEDQQTYIARVKSRGATLMDQYEYELD